ncbi:MAG: non-canonical purine NTP pyrophosphatase [Deltaproteobacteria bacterium]|nr:non-canonical purine NTP pyrophosphatase [Deltaproteobacteria bacterium]
MKTTPLYFVTSNNHKVREVSAFLNWPIEGVRADLDELQTTDLKELVTHKVRQAWAQVNAPVMVEDTALIFHAWGDLPGPFVRFFVERVGLDGMVRALSAFEDQRAEALCMIGLHDETGVRCFLGRASGRVVPPRGTQGFGWDALFLPEGSQLTYAEMTPEVKQRFSMRARALESLGAYLQDSKGEKGG